MFQVITDQNEINKFKIKVLEEYLNFNDFHFVKKSKMQSVSNYLLKMDISNFNKVVYPGIDKITSVIGATEPSYIEDIWGENKFYLVRYEEVVFAIRSLDKAVIYLYPPSKEIDMDNLCYDFLKNLHLKCNPDNIDDVLNVYHL